MVASLSNNSSVAFDGEESYDTTSAAPFFRKEFNIAKPVRSAKAKVTGVGYFEFYLNGKKVGVVSGTTTVQALRTIVERTQTDATIVEVTSAQKGHGVVPPLTHGTGTLYTAGP